LGERRSPEEVGRGKVERIKGEREREKYAQRVRISSSKSYSSEREKRESALVVAVDLKYQHIDRSIKTSDFETARKPVVTFLTLYHFTKNKYYYYIICAF